MSETPSKTEWWQIGLMLMAGYSAALTTYQAVRGIDTRQDKQIEAMQTLLCTTSDRKRQHACALVGIKSMLIEEDGAE